MSDNDFFSHDDGDRTVFVPRPANGRARPKTQAQSSQGQGNNARLAAQPMPTPPPVPQQPMQHVVDSSSCSNNVIRSAATALITLGVHLRNMNQAPDSNAIFQQICDDLKTLDKQLQHAGVTKEHAVTARYLICSFIDEMVMSTPWGAQSIWTHKSLLMTFHNNALGGIKFFEICEFLLQNPASNIDLIELCYVMISLGFEGKYRVSEGGRYELARISDNLYCVISANRPEVKKPLSVHSAGLIAKHELLGDNRLLWLSAACSLAIMVISFSSYFFSINQQSDPVAIRTAALGSNIEQLVRKPRSSNKKQLSGNMAQRLADDIASGLLAVNETADSVKITVSGKGLFEPASAQISQQRRAMLKRVAEAIAPEQGSLLIIGHTDDTPIRTLQFPSNWKLSIERAQSIAHFLQVQMADKTITTEGRADLQPLVPNDSRENREINRRIEINLFIS